MNSRYGTAAIAWSKTKYRHSSIPPKGVPVWWTGGSRGFGHVAISAGGGYVISTDSGGRGRVGRTSIRHITKAWGQQYRGWTEDINGVRVYRPDGSGNGSGDSASARSRRRMSSVLDASAVERLFRRGQKHRAVLIVQRALAAEVGLDFSTGPGTPGRQTKAAYARWQRKLGFRGDDADGIPGFTSLKRLGDRQGFGVVR
ncbi:MAG TPA: hypothetical protein VHI11_04980 [Jiangellaceae bacterium]|nr:hypothetical protein [Jiangellaceae bacterium]